MKFYPTSSQNSSSLLSVTSPTTLPVFRPEDHPGNTMKQNGKVRPDQVFKLIQVGPPKVGEGLRQTASNHNAIGNAPQRALATRTTAHRTHQRTLATPPQGTRHSNRKATSRKGRCLTLLSFILFFFFFFFAFYQVMVNANGKKLGNGGKWW